MDSFTESSIACSSYIIIFTGELIEKEEAKLLAEILHKTNFYTESDFADAKEFARIVIEEKMTYEFLQFSLNDEFLSQNLKDKLKSSEFI